MQRTEFDLGATALVQRSYPRDVEEASERPCSCLIVRRAVHEGLHNESGLPFRVTKDMDVIRLSQLLPGDAHYELTGRIADDMQKFMGAAFIGAPHPKKLNAAGVALEQVQAALSEAYGIG